MLVELRIIERELQRLDDKSATEGLTSTDCKSLEVLVKVRAVILANERLTAQPAESQLPQLNNHELRSLLRDGDD